VEGEIILTLCEVAKKVEQLVSNVSETHPSQLVSEKKRKKKWQNVLELPSATYKTMQEDRLCPDINLTNHSLTLLHSVYGNWNRGSCQLLIALRLLPCCGFHLSFHQPRKSRGDQRTRIWIYQQVLIAMKEGGLLHFHRVGEHVLLKPR